MAFMPRMQVQSTVDSKAEGRRSAGRWLKGLRESAGLSQRQLAERVGIDYYTFISQLEAGKGRVPAERYEAWAHALDVDAREFVRELMRCYEPDTYRILFEDK